MKFKKSQEEMIGFALIIVLVSVILLSFLGFSFMKTKGTAVQSYEAENFILTLLLYTSNCESGYGFYSLKELIAECFLDNQKTCQNTQEKICKNLNDTLKEILKESWEINENSKYKGYEFFAGQKEGNETIPILNIKEGKATRIYKVGSQIFKIKRKKFEAIFLIYE